MRQLGDGSPLQNGLPVHDRGWSVAASHAWTEQTLLSLMPASADDRS